MLTTITPSEMKRVEKEVMERTSITGDMLMQCAAAHVADAVQKCAAGKAGVVLCLCGTGNNGGDGMAAMRILAQRSACFSGECWVFPGRLSPDAQRELDRLKRTSVIIRMVEDTLPACPPQVVCAVDALFGTGLCRPLEGLALKAARLLNSLSAAVVAVDIPSGLNGETGAVMGEAVQADCTVTFHRPKPGLYLGQGPDCAGEIIIGDIGIPARLDDADGLRVLETADLPALLPNRRRVSHKGSYGRVLLLAGSRGMAGAAAIAANAALRTGAGLVTVACPETILDIVQVLCPCATCLPLPEDPDAAWELLRGAVTRCDALGAGCGMGQSAWAAELLRRLSTAQIHKPLVLDADALNLTAREKLSFEGAFITPHPAEAARLLGTDVQQIVQDAPAFAMQLCRSMKVSTVLKGACSVLCDAKQTALNPFGTPAMAKGGSGDALTGVITALLAGRAAGAYVMDDLTVMQAACALHGLAGEAAEKRYGQRGVLATDLCECLGLPVLPQKPAAPDETAGEDSSPLGRRVTVIVEHPAGTRDAQERTLVYRLHCGYVQEVLDEHNEWQDACVLGVSGPLEWFEGEVSACFSVNERHVWCVSSPGMRFTQEDVRKAAGFLGEVSAVRCLL